MSKMEDKDEKDNPYWAPVNFIDWSNDYRLPAVLSFSVFFGALILWMAIGWPVFKKIRNSLEEKGHKEGFQTVSSSTNCLIGFLPFGVCVLQQNKTFENHLRLIFSTFCGYGKGKVINFDRRGAKVILKNQYRNALQLAMSFIFGFSFAFFGHFIPCVWWTCDWGPEDGEQIRGLIWFIGWPCFTLLFLLISIFCLYIKIEAEGITRCCGVSQSSVWVSIGNNHYFKKPEDNPELLKLVHNDEIR